MDPRVGEPLLFGLGPERLFGCLHAVPAAPATQAALILPPAGHEYLSAHRSVRQLALRLADRGCTTLRMDLRGCGDAGGEKDSGNLAQWCEDAEQGLQLLAERAPGAALHVIGLRLGASLAALLGAQRARAGRPLASLTLWDAVVEGGDYLRAGLALQQARHGMRQGADDDGPREVLGYRWSAALVDELRSLRLTTLKPAPAARVLLIDTRAALLTPLADHWRALGAALDSRHLEAPDLWSGDGQVALIPTAVLQAITDWLAPA